MINRNSYHLDLSPVTTLAPVVIHVPAASGLSIPADFFGLCGSFGIVDINFFDAFVSNVIMPTLAAQGVNPGTFPIFQLYNVALSVGDPRICLITAASVVITPSNPTSRLTPRRSSTQLAFLAQKPKTRPLWPMR